MSEQGIERRTFLKGGGLIGVISASYLAIKKAAEPKVKPRLDDKGDHVVSIMCGKWSMSVGTKADGTDCLIYETKDGKQRGVIG